MTHIYLLSFFRILEVLDILHDVIEFLLPIGLRLLRGFLILGERWVISVDLLGGVHEILVIAVWIAHDLIIVYGCYGNEG